MKPDTFVRQSIFEVIVIKQGRKMKTYTTLTQIPLILEKSIARARRAKSVFG
jgi:hypothetical protein